MYYFTKNKQLLGVLPTIYYNHVSGKLERGEDRQCEIPKHRRLYQVSMRGTIIFFDQFLLPGY